MSSKSRSKQDPRAPASTLPSSTTKSGFGLPPPPPAPRPAPVGSTLHPHLPPPPQAPTRETFSPAGFPDNRNVSAQPRAPVRKTREFKIDDSLPPPPPTPRVGTFKGFGAESPFSPTPHAPRREAGSHRSVLPGAMSALTLNDGKLPGNIGSKHRNKKNA